MFTVPNGGQTAFVVDGRVWNVATVLTGVGSTQASCIAEFEPNGTVDLNSFGGQNWYEPTTIGVGSSYWVRATLLSGSVPSSGDSLNAWLQMNTTRSWAQTTTGSAIVRTRECVLKLEFATDSIGSNIVGTNTLTIEATVDNS